MRRSTFAFALPAAPGQNAPIDMVPDSVQEFMNDDGDEEMDVSDDEYEPTPEELEAEAQEEPCMMRDADRWDRFFTFNTDAQKSYTSDTDAYREARAVDYFNNSMACSRDILELKPTSESWVFHVSTFIVPRQIVALGEPAKRGCDAGESFGAMVKDIIKKLTCRRRVRTKSDISAHNANRAAGTTVGHESRRSRKAKSSSASADAQFARGYCMERRMRLTLGASSIA